MYTSPSRLAVLNFDPSRFNATLCVTCLCHNSLVVPPRAMTALNSSCFCSRLSQFAMCTCMFLKISDSCTTPETSTGMRCAGSSVAGPVVRERFRAFVPPRVSSIFTFNVGASSSIVFKRSQSVKMSDHFLSYRIPVTRHLPLKMETFC